MRLLIFLFCLLILALLYAPAHADGIGQNRAPQDSYNGGYRPPLQSTTTPTTLTMGSWISTNELSRQPAVIIDLDYYACKRDGRRMVCGPRTYKSPTSAAFPQ